ncbi:hypothetical protein Q8F55_001970 [Vanrija albida]|uniref:Glycerophosphocholine acyltransferase 1 n=1 Tax=Vanrija albida TaxID=181172 RepID=A0ABR3Q8F8_9TREE
MAETDSPIIRPTTPSEYDGPPRIPLNRSSSSLSGLAHRGAERAGEDWSGGLVLLDTIETFFDSRLDLIERRLKASSAKIRKKAGDLLPKGLRTPGGGGSILLLDDEDEAEREAKDKDQRGLTKRGQKYKQDAERELARLKVKLAGKVTNLSASWHSAKTVRFREKISFFFGVWTLAFACLLYGMAPSYFPLAYTIQSAFYLPTRAWLYKRKQWHYFLFDMCYFVNALDLIWLWIFPNSTILFICCYLLTLGPLASAIITWRNSLVFHSLDKVTSLYPPIVLSVVLFHYPNAVERYPGLAHINEYSWIFKIALAAVPYCLWQGSYFKFISIDRKDKIESGQRANSFQYLLNDKRGPIGRALRNIRPEHRELWFIFGQFIYSIIFMLLPATLLIHSQTATNIYLIIIFSSSIWNGATFYVEVFGRKFERELERLRKEMDALTASNSSSTGNPTPSNPGTPYLDSPLHTGSLAGSANGGDDLANSPLVLPNSSVSEVPSISLGAAAEAVDTVGKPKTE